MKRGLSRLLLLFVLLLLGCQATPTPLPSEPVAVPEAPTVTTVDATPTPLGPTPTALVAPSSECDPAAAAVDPPYKDPQLCIEARVEDLLARMSLAEKVGQMTQVEKNSIEDSDITDLYIGSLLSGGAGYPDPNEPEAWADMIDGFQQHALETPLQIPLLYGVDAVHGHNNMRGAVIFPHNIGLGATRNPELVARVAEVTAEEMLATGARWNFAPVVAVPQDIRWGRTYEGYSENTELVSELATAYLRALQGGETPMTILGTPKHFVGDGGTAWGSSTTGDYQIDQGVTEVDEATLRAVHLPPYEAAIDAGAMSIMVSFSSWGDLKMHAQEYLLTDVLKEELGFRGFLVSDWEAIDQIPGEYYSDVVTSINAGLDMVMVPYNYDLFIFALTSAVENGDVPEERVDDAVRRILAAKFQLGLFEQPFADRSLLPEVGSEAHREVAREAVRESLVLLKNEGETLPLSTELPLIFVAGEAADDIGIQSGGWTIEWQGKVGSITPGTTIRQAIENAVSPETVVQFNRWGNYDRILDEGGNPAIADVGIVVVGEMPYAEGLGDREDLSLSEEDAALIERVKERSEKVVIILISGRPLIVTEHLDEWDALVAAWLPGTEGQGVADMLFGDYPFTGRLSYAWPRSMEQVPRDPARDEATGCDAPLFPYGFGLGETPDEATEQPECPTPTD
ncbi:MAG TPA: glycoside hydrolase family 3 N-terminal domain-containing protein [Ardenticatenaceae bacterium]